MNHIICYFLIFFMESVILWQYSSNLFVPRRSLPARITILCVLYCILFFAASLFQSNGINAFLYLFSDFIFLETQYRLKAQSAFFHSAILSAVMGMCELLVYGIFKCFAPHFLENGRDAFHLFLFATFSKLLFFTITHILIHYLKGKKHYEQPNDNSVFFLLLVPLASLFIILTFINIGESVSLSPELDFMIAISAISLLAANLLVFSINQYNQKKNMEFTEMQLLLQKESNSEEYYEMLRLQNENQRILIHDIKKHLQSIDLVKKQNEPDKIDAYIHQLMLSSDLRESARLCDHALLNSILCRYMRQCNEHHIDFHTDIRSGTTDFIADTDLTSLVCNLLDNAYEAAQGIPNAFIELNTGKREKTPFVVITIINSCRKNPFSETDGSLLTTKNANNQQGLGIKSIGKTINHYHGYIKRNYDDSTKTFHTIITIKQP